MCPFKWRGGSDVGRGEGHRECEVEGDSHSWPGHCQPGRTATPPAPQKGTRTGGRDSERDRCRTGDSARVQALCRLGLGGRLRAGAHPRRPAAGGGSPTSISLSARPARLAGLSAVPGQRPGAMRAARVGAGGPGLHPLSQGATAAGDKSGRRTNSALVALVRPARQRAAARHVGRACSPKFFSSESTQATVRVCGG